MSRMQSIDQALSVNVLQHLFKHKKEHRVVFLLMHKELDLTKEQSKSCIPCFSNFTTGIQFESKVTPSSTIRLQRQMKHNSLALDHFRHQTERRHRVSGAGALMRRSKSSFTCISVWCNQKTYSCIFLTRAASVCFLLAQHRPERKQNKRELAVIIIIQQCEYLWSWNILQNLFVPLVPHFSTHRQSANAFTKKCSNFPNIQWEEQHGCLGCIQGKHCSL